MKIRASLVIIKNSKILLMHRFCIGKEYFVLPGGGVENNENITNAAIREAKEETNLSVKIDKELFNYINNFDNRLHYVFLIKIFNGKLRLSGPESKRNTQNNKYILEWHDIQKIGELNLYPIYIKNNLYDHIKND